METIIAACVTGGLTFVGTVVVAVIGYWKQTHNDFEKAKDDRSNNTKEIIYNISSVKDIMIEEKTANQYRYQNMNDTQRNIVDSVKTLDGFSKEMGRLIQQNEELKQQGQQCKELLLKNQQLEKQLRELQEQNRQYQQLDQQCQYLQQQNQVLEQKYENLVKQMEDDVLSVIPKTGRDDRDDLER